MLEDQNYQVLGHRHDISIAHGAAQLTVEVLCNKSRLAPYCPISSLLKNPVFLVLGSEFQVITAL
jgi:hypothetical protein